MSALATTINRWRRALMIAREVLLGAVAVVAFVIATSFFTNAPLSLLALAGLPIWVVVRRTVWRRKIEKISSKDHERLITAARLYAIGQYEEAERSLAIADEVDALDRPGRIQVAKQLARLRVAQRRYDEAEELYRQILAISEKKLGPYRWGLVLDECLNDLARVCRARGRLDDAAELYRRALATREKALGREHPDVLSALSNLAGVYAAQGKSDEAKAIRQRAHAVDGGGISGVDGEIGLVVVTSDPIPLWQVNFFSSVAHAEGYIELPEIESGYWRSAYDAVGRPFDIRIEKGRTVIRPIPGAPPDPKALMDLLIGFLKGEGVAVGIDDDLAKLLRLCSAFK
jgi:tetratricopeptide (TPR) repeat protein